MRVGLWVVAVVAGVPVGLAGCLQVQDDVFEIPLPRVGDEVEWRAGLGNHSGKASLRVGAPMTVRDAWGAMREAVPVDFAHGADPQGREVRGTRTYVDAASNLVLAVVGREGSAACDLCPFAVAFEPEGLPWGYGSSLFHGRTFRPGEAQEVVVHVGQAPVVLRLEPVRTEMREGRLALMVTVALPVEVRPVHDAFHAFDARFWLLDRLPYVWAAEFPGAEGARYAVELRRYRPGDLPVGGTQAPVRGDAAGEPWAGLRPPGAAAPVPGSRYTVEHAVDAALETDEAKRLRERSTQFVLTHVRIHGDEVPSASPAGFVSRFDRADVMFMNERLERVRVGLSRTEGGVDGAVLGPRERVEVEEGGGGHPHRFEGPPARLVPWGAFLDAWRDWTDVVGAQGGYGVTVRVAVSEPRYGLVSDLARWEYALHEGLHDHGSRAVVVDAETGHALGFVGTAQDLERWWSMRPPGAESGCTPPGAGPKGKRPGRFPSARAKEIEGGSQSARAPGSSSGGSEAAWWRRPPLGKQAAARPDRPQMWMFGWYGRPPRPSSSKADDASVRLQLLVRIPGGFRMPTPTYAFAESSLVRFQVVCDTRGSANGQ